MCGVHKSTSLMSSSLLLQQCPACLVHLTWIVFMTGGRWPCILNCANSSELKNLIWIFKFWKGLVLLDFVFWICRFGYWCFSIIYILASTHLILCVKDIFLCKRAVLMEQKCYFPAKVSFFTFEYNARLNLNLDFFYIKFLTIWASKYGVFFNVFFLCHLIWYFSSPPFLNYIPHIIHEKIGYLLNLVFSMSNSSHHTWKNTNIFLLFYIKFLTQGNIVLIQLCISFYVKFFTLYIRK